MERGAIPGLRSGGTILVGTDFSAAADNAVAWATMLARRRGARLVLFHAVPPPQPSLDHVTVPGELAEAVEAAAREHLERARSALATDGLEVISEVRVAPPWRAVAEAAEDADADLTVVGTHGLGAIERIFLGSTVARVVQSCRLPVLSVHPDDEPRADLASVLVPTDFSEDARLAAAAVQASIGLDGDGARLTLLHVYGQDWSYAAYGARGLALFAQRHRTRLVAGVEESLNDLADQLRKGGLAVEAEVREGHPARVIAEEAERRSVDLIAMGTRGRTGVAHLLLGSTAQKVIREARCPVLTVHRGS